MQISSSLNIYRYTCKKFFFRHESLNVPNIWQQEEDITDFKCETWHYRFKPFTYDILANNEHIHLKIYNVPL